jgi:FSR family fosmidomycin resistance protein-like MFS transporter
MRRIARVLLPHGVDRRGIGVLSAGHVASDLFQGAITALLPFFVAERGYSYTQVGALLLVASLGSALFQPLLGVMADRMRSGWMMPAGLGLAGVGFAAAGLAPSYAWTLAALLVGGVGVAAFHPEAIRFASNVSGGRKGTGMSLFAVGGSLGFTLGPVLTTPVALAFGLRGTPVVGAVILVVGLYVLLNLRYVEGFRHVESEDGEAGAGRDDWGRFGLISGTAITRGMVGFGLQAFVPAYLIAQQGTSEAVANAAITVFFAATLVGTLVGGQLADRFGFARIAVGSIVAAVPLMLAIPFVGIPGVFAALLLVGFSSGMNFYPLVVLAQRAIPSHLGLAAGVILGMSIGLGSASVALLGVLADATSPRAAVLTVAGIGAVSGLFALLLLRRPRGGPVRVALGATNGESRT